ncbi:transposase [Sinorhizobium medicae]|uniref:transposase n=1 Tax=Sinorhizobium medicae TaxID=110321 RepID=UPI00307F0D7A
MAQEQRRYPPAGHCTRRRPDHCKCHRAAVRDGRQFQSARHFAAWLGLTPRMHASGKKERIGRISKGGD